MHIPAEYEVELRRVEHPQATRHRPRAWCEVVKRDAADRGIATRDLLPAPMLSNLRERAMVAYGTPQAKKARRVAYHVLRAAKKFVAGSGNALWVTGTTMLVMVMPLVFEIDREQQLLDYEGGMVMPPR